MSTIRTYVKKSVKLALVVIAAIFAVAVTFLVVFNFLPGKLQGGLFIAIANFKRELGTGVTVSILFYLGYKAYRVIKTANSPLQEFINMFPAIVVWLCIVTCSFYFLEQTFEDTDCQHHNYNVALNGGVKEVNGENYTINLCGNGGDKNQNNDQVQFEILNNQGTLVAKRHFTVNWDTSSHHPIEIQTDKIIYYDDADSYDSQRVINMPPSLIDWIQARLPL